MLPRCRTCCRDTDIEKAALTEVPALALFAWIPEFVALVDGIGSRALTAVVLVLSRSH
jgi:hypothetical protein